MGSHRAPSVDSNRAESGSHRAESDVAEAIQEVAGIMRHALAVPAMAPSRPAQSSADWDGVGAAYQRALPSIAPHGSFQLALPSVVVPREKLLVMQDNLQRAEHAMSSSMNIMCASARAVQSEQQIIKNTIDVVAAHTGVEPRLP